MPLFGHDVQVARSVAPSWYRFTLTRLPEPSVLVPIRNRPHRGQLGWPQVVRLPYHCSVSRCRPEGRRRARSASPTPTVARRRRRLCRCPLAPPTPKDRWTPVRRRVPPGGGRRTRSEVAVNAVRVPIALPLNGRCGSGRSPVLTPGRRQLAEAVRTFRGSQADTSTTGRSAGVSLRLDLFTSPVSSPHKWSVVAGDAAFRAVDPVARFLARRHRSR
jgi:hypothetical protein